MICEQCAYAKWDLTKTGRLSPTGDGRCMYVAAFQLPKAFYFIGGYPIPGGGHINRMNGNSYEGCPTFKQGGQHDS